MEEALIAFLLLDPSLGALVGDRINWGTMPQGQTLPAIILRVISSVPEYSVDLFENKLTQSRVQVEVWGLIYSDAKFAARAVFNKLSAAQATIQGIEFQAIFQDTVDESFTMGPGDRNLWLVRQDFMIWHAAT